MSAVAGLLAPATLDSLHVGMGWPDEQPGGLNRMVANLVHHLPQAGIAAHALVAGSPQVARLSHGRARAFAGLDEALPLRCWHACEAVHQAARARRPDILALHFPLFGLPARLGLARDIARIVHFHGPWASEGTIEGGSAAAAGAKRWIERRAYAGAARYVTLSRAFAQLLERDYGAAPERVRIVPGGVDCARFAPTLARAEARAVLGLPADRVILVAVRRLARRMGLHELMAAFAAVRLRVPDALLVIGGQGPLRAPLQAQLAELGLERHVRLLGHVPEPLLPTLYRAADLTVVPSTALEGFGLTSVESLATGTPALVSPVGGLPETVAGLAQELVLPGLAPDVLADTLTAALRGRLALPTAQACVEHVRRHFAWPVVAARLATIYREALA
ncbi:MAG: glycosyltransferase family 4 protein [Geminicoccaceae bacterium]